MPLAVGKFRMADNSYISYQLLVGLLILFLKILTHYCPKIDTTFLRLLVVETKELQIYQKVKKGIFCCQRRFVFFAEFKMLKKSNNSSIWLLGFVWVYVDIWVYLTRD